MARIKLYVFLVLILGACSFPEIRKDIKNAKERIHAQEREIASLRAEVKALAEEMSRLSGTIRSTEKRMEKIALYLKETRDSLATLSSEARRPWSGPLDSMAKSIDGLKEDVAGLGKRLAEYISGVAKTIEKLQKGYSGMASIVEKDISLAVKRDKLLGNEISALKSEMAGKLDLIMRKTERALKEIGGRLEKSRKETKDELARLSLEMSCIKERGEGCRLDPGPGEQTSWDPVPSMRKNALNWVFVGCLFVLFLLAVSFWAARKDVGTRDSLERNNTGIHVGKKEEPGRKEDGNFQEKEHPEGRKIPGGGPRKAIVEIPFQNPDQRFHLESGIISWLEQRTEVLVDPGPEILAKGEAEGKLVVSFWFPGFIDEGEINRVKDALLACFSKGNNE